MTQRLLLPASRFLLALALLLLVVGTGLLAAGAGAAALEPVETDPRAGAEVGELHEAIRITFDEPLLLERGVVKGTQKFYMSLAHTEEDVQATIRAFRDVAEQLRSG